MQRAIALAGDGAPAADLYAELVFQTLVRSGMWRAIPDPTHIQDWIERTLETAAPTSAARAKALVARCYAAYDKPAELAHEAREIAEARDDAVLRSYCYDALALERFATGDYDAAADWNQRRLALAEELHDPDGEADIYANAIAPVVARGSFDEALAYAISHDTLTSGLSPHHRLHGVSALLELEEMLGRWEAAIALQPRVEESVAANADTPCVRNQRSLLVCALAQLYAGDRSEGLRLEQAAEAHSMTGYGTVLDTPRLLLALERGDLDAVAALIGEPGVRRTNWFYLSSMAAHLDGLAALGRRERVEAEATPHLRPGTYLEPFALRALGQVADDAAALARAAEAFEGLGLAWHAGRTRRLAASQSTQ